MNTPIGVPHSSDVIPEGTGLVQTVECKGVEYDEEAVGLASRFELPVLAQISTFSNGIRRVCCPQADHHKKDGK
jgi:hypothetical protein